MYNKLFSSILDSSIWLEPNPTRIVWITLLATMDEDGFCRFAKIENLRARARVSMPEAEKAISALEDPDGEAGEQDFDGRRIERVPGGWLVLNAAKYRDLVTRAVNREQTRQRVSRYRQRKRAENKGVTQL